MNDPGQLGGDGGTSLVEYKTVVSDNSRWNGFEFRSDDIVISTPPKCGTTWVQMLVALLIFDGPDFPERLGDMSPWLDMCNRPAGEVMARLDAQTHRRFIKTHTPLDGVPYSASVTYLMVGRDPRDVAISFEHHMQNWDLEQFIRIRAETVGLDDIGEIPVPPPDFDDPVQRFRYLVQSDEKFGPPTLAATLHHLATGWSRRHLPNVCLMHYSDLKADLPGEIERLASVLGIEVTGSRAQELAAEASLDRMRDRADDLAPGGTHVGMKEPRAFFRTGGSGEWRERVSAGDLAAYDERVAALAPPDLAAWAHQGRHAPGIDLPRS